MAAVIIEIAEAVKDALNGASLSQSFTAEWTFDPRRSLEGLTDLTVLVSAAEQAMEKASRGADDFGYAVQVAVAKRLSVAAANDDDQLSAECEPLMLLVQEIIDLFRGPDLVGSLPARFDRAENAPIYDGELLHQKRVFLSAVTLRFEAVRSK